ncbi:MAG TPA: hypothetical protein VLB29_07085, partial [Nocardioidaceae bacterium]|nr:hypothetical protein [Nocardioidaceae bacterium]
SEPGGVGGCGHVRSVVGEVAGHVLRSNNPSMRTMRPEVVLSITRPLTCRGSNGTVSSRLSRVRDDFSDTVPT